MRTPLCLLLYLATTFPVGAQGLPAAPAPAPSSATMVLPGYDLVGLRAAEHRRAVAVANRDIPALRKLIAGDYYHVKTTGRVRSKTEFLQLLTRDEYEFRSYEVLDMEVRVLDNGRSAVVTGRFNADLQQGETHREFRGRYVRMWAQTPDGWRNTMQQTTEIKSAGPPRPVRTGP